MTEKTKCKRCGRVLKSKESIAKGYGTTCYKKFLESKKITLDLFDLEE